MASPPRSYRMALRWDSALASSSVSSRPPSLGTTASQRSSTALMDLRTSPPQPWATSAGTSGSHVRGRGVRVFMTSKARSTAGRISSAGTDLNSNTLLRESSALYT